MAKYEAIVFESLEQFVDHLNEFTKDGKYHVHSSNAFVNEDGVPNYYALLERPDGLYDWKSDVLSKLDSIESNTGA